MKACIIFVILATILVVIQAQPFNDRVTLPRPNPGSRNFPSFPGYGSFNPRASGRHRRSPGGSISVDQPVNGRGTVSVDAERKIYEGENGHVSVYGHGNVQEGGRPQGHAGVRAEFHWDD